MRAKVKKIIPYIFIVGLSVLLLSSLVYFGFKDKNMVRVANDQSSKMQYVLVNEDKGASFEGKYYSLGTDFVTLINKDTTNRWETATRDIATSGVENGQFDAQIIIPQDFSEKILSLQAIAPEKAQIEYQVRDGQNEITNQMIQNQVNGILKEFNRRVIQMYFSSIVNNLAEAQQNVTQIVDTQLDQQADLENEIYTPFKEIPTSYTTVLNTASILDEDNKLFSAEQEAFVKSVQSLLDNNNAHLTSSSETTESVKKSVEEYSKEGNEKIKKSVQQFNEQYELHKKQLVNQWEKATTDYKKEFDQLNTTILDQMGNFYLSNNQGESGVYVDFLAESKLFQETQADRIKELQMEIAELHSQVEQLTALKKQIAKTYYNDSEATPETATDEQVKQAIIQLITGEKENIPKLKKNYEENLQNLIAQLPYESLKKLIDKLEKNGILTSDQTIIFRNELQIVDKYAKDSGIGFGADVQFLYLEPKQIHDHTITIPKKVTFSLDTTKKNRIVLEGSNHENIAFILNQNQMNTIKSEINIQLEKAGYKIPTIQSTPTQIIIPQPIKIKDGISENISEKENQNNSEEVIDNFKSETASLPNTVSFSIEIPLEWTLTTEQQQTAYQSIDYSWKVNDEIQNEGSFAVYIPMDKPLVQDIPELLKQIQVLDNAAQQVVTLFGTPNETLSIQDYINMLNQEKNKDKSIKELAGKD
ncbi:type VII secretion protein EsaA, partial [Enterococcus faecium]|nr:type VII secretion protein EsaA [Enterococcus faecium]